MKIEYVAHMVNDDGCFGHLLTSLSEIVKFIHPYACVEWHVLIGHKLQTADEVILQAPSPRRCRRMQWLTNAMRVQRHAHGRSDGGPHRCCQQQRIMVFGQQPIFQ